MTNKKIKAARFGGSPIGEAHATLKDISANCGLNEGEVAEGMAELEAAGLIKKIGEDKYEVMPL